MVAEHLELGDRIHDGPALGHRETHQFLPRILVPVHPEHHDVASRMDATSDDSLELLADKNGKRASRGQVTSDAGGRCRRTPGNGSPNSRRSRGRRRRTPAS
jgi:hypothetical protein